MTRRLAYCVDPVVLAVALLSAMPCCTHKVFAEATAAPAKGRIYIFRMVRSYGAHIDDSVTINGASIQKITPGNGIYCDVTPGDYIVGLAQRKAQPIKASVCAG